MIISTNEHDQHCYMIAPMQQAIRLYNLMWDNVRMVNPVNLVKFVKGFSQVLDNYGQITLKELYRSQCRIFLSIMGQGESVPVQLQKYAYKNSLASWGRWAKPALPQSRPSSTREFSFVRKNAREKRIGSSRSTAVSSIRGGNVIRNDTRVAVI